jgi:hypothetical protein
MTTSNKSGAWRALSLPVVATAALVSLAACAGGGITPPAGSTGNSGGGGGGGGGGTTLTPTAYTLFASNYVAYAAQTNNAFLHSFQGGDVFTGFGGNFVYGNYSASQDAMNSTQFYNLQLQANSVGGAAGDFMYIAIKSPGSNTAGSTAVPPLDISQAGTLLIQMGNTYTQGDIPNATGGHAKVVTVVLNDDTSLAQDGSHQTALCTFDQTLTTGSIGRGVVAALGVMNYAIPLSSFTCSTGTMAALKAAGVTSVAVKYTGDKNATITAGEFDTLAVGYVGFSK